MRNLNTNLNIWCELPGKNLEKKTILNKVESEATTFVSNYGVITEINPRKEWSIEEEEEEVVERNGWERERALRTFIVEEYFCWQWQLVLKIKRWWNDNSRRIFITRLWFSERVWFDKRENKVAYLLQSFKSLEGFWDSADIIAPLVREKKN